MTWQIAGWPDFLTDDAELMLAEFAAYEYTAVRRSFADETAYAELYAAVFGRDDVRGFIFQPPRAIADGINRFVREIGLYVLADDGVALAHLADHAKWQPLLPPVRQARPGYYTASRTQQLENRNAMAALIHRAGALAFAERLPSLALGSAAGATTLRETLLALFDQVEAEAAARNDGTLRMLRQVKTLALVLINKRALSPIENEILLTNSAMPSLVCAHWSYRDARQAPRIRNANPTAHPNFMAPQVTVPAWP